MEVTNTMDVAAWVRKHLDDADPDLVRTMLQTFAEALMARSIVRRPRSSRWLRRSAAASPGRRPQ